MDRRGTNRCNESCPVDLITSLMPFSLAYEMVPEMSCSVVAFTA